MTVRSFKQLSVVYHDWLAKGWLTVRSKFHPLALCVVPWLDGERCDDSKVSPSPLSVVHCKVHQSALITVSWLVGKRLDDIKDFERLFQRYACSTMQKMLYIQTVFGSRGQSADQCPHDRMCRLVYGHASPTVQQVRYIHTVILTLTD